MWNPLCTQVQYLTNLVAQKLTSRGDQHWLELHSPDFRTSGGQANSARQKTKLRILNSNVLFVLLYGAEMWRVTAADLNKVDVFHRTCLRRVLRRFWPNHLSNEELYEATGSTPVSALIRVRRQRWIGHILRTSPSNISRTALTWAPEGKRRRGRPRETWRRTVEKERNQLGWHSWGAVAALAAD